MRKLDKKATAIFGKLTEGLTKIGDHRKISNATGFMPVSVEIVGSAPAGKIVAVAHYYEQNRDLMADPDMTFVVADEGIFPLTYQQDNLGIYQEAGRFEGSTLRVNPRLQSQLAKFANQWMRNIEDQQFHGE